MKISVVIPTYNEEQHLGECLEALLNGSEKPDEVIVADGCSTDKTRDIAKQYGAIVVENEKRHAAGGRNAGIKKAQGSVIAFIDADCIPDKDWLKEIHKAFEEDDIDGLGTYIEAAPAKNIYEEFWSHLSLQILMSYGNEPYYVTEKSLNTAFITASCAYKKSLLDEINGFSDYFGNNAEDIDICWRALDAGAKLKYVPSAKIIAHGPDNLSGICKKSFRNGISSSKLQKVHFEKRINVDNMLHKALFVNIFKSFTGDRYARLFVVELVCHMAGKLKGSFMCGVVNL